VRKGRALWALLALWPALSLADATVPDTPAGRALAAWLDVINHPERARQEAFLKAFPSWMNPDELTEWSSGTGGYDLLEVSSSDPANVFIHVKQRRWAVEEVGRLEVSTTDLTAIETLGLWRMPPGAKFDPITLDDPARARVIEIAAGHFGESYVDAGIARKMAAALRKNLGRGDYRNARYGDAFARRLTEELQEISHDKHVELRFNHFTRPADSMRAKPEEEARRMAAINCGFEKVEHRPPNIGYLKFNMFADPGICAATASAAMTYLADSDALVMDLRDNRGGNPDMALLVMSYLFDAPRHIADTFDRAEKSPKQTWTLASVSGKKFIGKPVFVLISNETFSAGEATAYYLQAEKRATLIGETTPGGGHLTKNVPIDDHFMIRVPHARSTSPVTKTGWQGTGVTPDFEADAADALDAALKLAAAGR
jgi:hypothetical protein